jgi:hypothetical protein
MSFSSEILFISDEFAPFGRHPGPDDLQVGVADKNSMKS